MYIPTLQASPHNDKTAGEEDKESEAFSLIELLSRLQLDKQGRAVQERQQKLFDEFSLKGIAELIHKIQTSENSMWKCIHYASIVASPQYVLVLCLLLMYT